MEDNKDQTHLFSVRVKMAMVGIIWFISYAIFLVWFVCGMLPLAAFAMITFPVSWLVCGKSLLGIRWYDWAMLWPIALIEFSERWLHMIKYGASWDEAYDSQKAKEMARIEKMLGLDKKK
tara:strand:- start:362 stop:721 length:360 start_codon:yes stop_codon:yes gene_type:complete